MMLVGLAAVAGWPPAAQAMTFTVNSVADTDDGSCDSLNTGPGNQDCTLREAINEANAFVSTLTDTIAFAIPGAGLHTIQPLTQLPDLTDRVFINGYSQPGSSVNTQIATDNAALRIELDGSLGGFINGLVVRWNNCTIRGLVINRFRADPFSGTGGIGIDVHEFDTRVQGNFIGTDASGMMDLGNETAGVRFAAGASNYVGWSTVDHRNIVSGNARGIVIESDGDFVGANFIGVNALGAVLGNDFDGLLIEGDDNTVGGGAFFAPGVPQGNVIAGNPIGVNVTGNDNFIQGNLIGTDPTGQAAVANGTAIRVGAPGSGNRIGGTAPNIHNTISGNIGGIHIDG